MARTAGSSALASSTLKTFIRGRTQESGLRTQHDKAAKPSYRFSFLLVPEFCVLTPDISMFIRHAYEFGGRVEVFKRLIHGRFDYDARNVGLEAVSMAVIVRVRIMITEEGGSPLVQLAFLIVS